MIKQDQMLQILMAALTVLFVIVAFETSSMYEPFRLWLDETFFQPVFEKIWPKEIG